MYFKKIKKLHLLKPTLLILIVSFFVASCYKDRFDFDKIAGGIWNPTMAVPLIYGDLTMKSVVENSADLWIEYPDGLLSLIYRGDTSSRFGDEIFQFPNQSFDTSVYLAMPPALFPGDSTSKFFLVQPSLNVSTGERIDSILIKSGTLKLEFSTNLNHQGYFEIIIPSLTKYGVTFIYRISIPGSGPMNIVKEVPLADYMLKTKQSGGKTVVDEYVKVMIRKGNNSDNSPYQFSVKQSLTNISYYQAYGFFGQHNFPINETVVPITLFENVNDNQFVLEDARMKLNFINNYGFPVDMTFSKLYVSKGSSLMNITGTNLPTMSLDYPLDMGTSKTTSFVFDKSNSNMVDVVNFQPEKLVYAGNCISNPLGTLLQNFIEDTSRVRVGVEVEIPLHGRAMKYTLRDTSDIDLSSTYDGSLLKSIDLNIIAQNYFPADAMLQLYLADSNNVVFDSIFTGQVQVIKAAIPGPPPEYRVTVPSQFIVRIPLSETKMDNLIKARKMIISAHANTYDGGTKIIKIYSDYKIGFAISTKGEFISEY